MLLPSFGRLKSLNRFSSPGIIVGEPSFILVCLLKVLLFGITTFYSNFEQVRTPDEVLVPGLIVSVEDFEWLDSDFFATDFRETREPNELIFDLNIMLTVLGDHRQLTIEHNVRFRPCGQGWISGIELPRWPLLNINRLVILQHYQMSTFCPHFVPIHQY